MDQSLQLLHAAAEQAFRRVADHYAIPCGLTYPQRPIFKLFHFVEASRWDYYLKHIAQFKVEGNAAAEVEGVTHSYGQQPQIGINRDYHTQATLIHESIHFFSHYQFRRSFPVAVFEGATEFLTRNLLGNFGPRQDVHGQGDIYANEIAIFTRVLKGVIDMECLNRAYFKGDSSSISHLEHRLQARTTSS